MPFERSKYPPDWAQISLARRQAAGWRCEWCNAAHGQPHPKTGKKVVLTVAHLGTPHADGRPGNKHDKADCRPENLAALCQRCHLNYDRPDHMAKAAATRARKKAARAWAQLSFDWG